jgi:hypothetical protein
MERRVREQRRLSQDGAGFGSATGTSAPGAVGNGDWRHNRLGDPETKEGLIPRLGGGARRGVNVTGAVMVDHMGYYV